MPIPLWWMLNGMTQCLVFVLACKMGQILHNVDFERKNVTTPQNVPHFLSHSCKRRFTKGCTWVHTYRPCAIHCGSLSAGYTRKFLHLVAPRNATQAEMSWYWRPRYNPIRWVTQNYCVNVVVTHVLRVILDVKFDGSIHFYVRLILRSRSGQSQVK